MTSATTHDEIALTGLTVFGNHGVYDSERREGQNFIVDLTMYVDTRAAAASDDVRDTVHYGEIAQRVADIVAGEPVNLLEALAERIAVSLLTIERIGRVRVTLHKPNAPIALSFDDVSVSIERAKP
ncbi:dihydroneopterin aldolase [Microbacterium marmarense]|uniref:7,8-dihydroneopterin aldolase n=1 Tax=Microbacterium marmarense TaxID=3122051 RepID=A0ABU8LRI2_9MICO